jgi:hypothetical protein
VVLKRALVLGLLLVPAGAVAQVFPIPPLVSHVIVDSCSGCGGSGTVGQATMAASAPVVIASDQSSVHVTCDSGCGSPPATADGTAFVSGTTNVSPVAAVVDDVAPTTVPEDAYGAPRMSTNRVLYVDLKQTQANATAIKVDGSAVIQPVSGTVTASGPVTDTQLRATPVPVSGTVTVTDGAGALNVIVDSGSITANAGTNLNTSALALDATLTGRTQKAQITDGTRDGTVKAASTLPLATDTALVVTTRDTVTVSGTVTTTPPSNASTNVAQLAGTTTDTNSGLKSAGTLRVVLATDQPALTNKLLVTPDSVALPANQSVNVAQMAGTTTDTNSGTKSAGTLRVVLATDQPALTNKLLVTPDSVALPANQSVNVAQVAGTNTVNGGLAGTLAVGGTAGNNAAITQNPIVGALEARSSTPTQATNGNQIRQAGDLAGNTFNVMPIAWSCNLAALGATLTQCQAAPSASYSLYITAIIATTTTGTAGTFNIQRGTGSNCATGPTGVWPSPGTATPSRVVTAPIVTAAPMVINLGPVGIKVTAANAICVIGVATNTIDIVLSGYTAP